MAYTTPNYDFTDWLYNRYVEARRKNDFLKAFVFLDVLNQFVIWTDQPKYRQQKRYAKELIKAIGKAVKNSTAHRLLLRGEEGQREFEQKMAAYEKELNEIGYDQETIRELVIDKRWNYGND